MTIEFLPKHVSHSSINSYLRCGKAFELEKVQHYPQTPAWWLLGGSAVHQATEWLDKDEWDDTPESAFHYALFLEVDKAREVEPDDSKWLKAGYGGRAQGYEHWSEKGPRYVRQWYDREWPGGADHSWVELDVSTTLPSGIEIKAYIDRVIVGNSLNWTEIVDLKTGGTRPDSDQQMGIYSVLLREWFRTKFGLPYVADYEIKAFNYMFKDDEFYEVDVRNWTLDTVDQLAQQWMKGVTNGIFLPNRGKLCGTCSVSGGCFLQSGYTDLTRKYDRLNPYYREQ